MTDSDKKASFWHLALSWFAVMLCANCIRMGMTFDAVSAGVSALEIGLVSAFGALIPAFAAVETGRLFGRLGPGIVSLWALFCAAAGGLLLFLFPPASDTVYVMALSCALTGLAFMSCNTVMLRATGIIYPASGRTRAFSWIAGLTSGLDILVPAGVGLLLESVSHETVYFIFTASLLIGVPSALSVPVKRLAQKTRVKARPFAASLLLTVKSRPLFAAVLIAVGTHVISFVYGLLIPLSAPAFGLSTADAGKILSVFAVATFCASAFLSVFPKVFSSWQALRISLLLAGASLMLQPFSESEAWLYLVTLFSGFGLGLVFPNAMSLIYDYADEASVGDVVSVRLMFNNVGRVFAPVFLGCALHGMSHTAVFLGLGAVVLAGFFLIPREVRS